MYQKYIKRGFDFILALIASIILSPVILIVAVLVRIKLGSPVLFKQPRPGKNEKIFNMYKFRTMTDARDENGELLPDEVRLTKFGKTLRSTSLDELPELFNILKGDMSIIGPRPALPREVAEYGEFDKLRLLVKPGLSCYWQVSGRSNIPFDEWMKLDVKYIKEMSLLTDIKIILLTFPAVFKGDGAY